MLLLDDMKRRLDALVPQREALREAIAYDKISQRKDELDHRTADPGFWQDSEAQAAVFAELGPIKSKIEMYNAFCAALDDAETFYALCAEENDESELPTLEQAVEDAEKKGEELRMRTLLNGEYDEKNAILTFHAGAGGTEAQDWAEMLYRMYTRWAAAHGCKLQVLDYQDGDEAGLKSASVLVEGPSAYGLLRGENGVHRLVRVSPFDAAGRRHTSFASLEVMPDIDDTIVVDIRDEDIKMEVYRASGAGGQHINKTSSAVRLIHIPTGIVVACQTERSQYQNRDYAMKMLRAKLFQIKEREHLEKIEDIKGDQKEIAWGSQIRSYVFMPYTMVKDHRTGFETGNVDAVMNGDLDGFIDAFLAMNARAQ